MVKSNNLLMATRNKEDGRRTLSKLYNQPYVDEVGRLCDVHFISWHNAAGHDARYVARLIRSFIERY